MKVNNWNCSLFQFQLKTTSVTGSEVETHRKKIIMSNEFKKTVLQMKEQND